MKGALLLVALLLLSCRAPQATLNSGGCPIDDEAACGIAIEVANAMAAKDAGRLVELSRTDTINCAEVARDYFPGCAKAETLEGHGLSDAELTVEVVDEAGYEARVDSLLETINEPVEILGIGTCGPPGRRTYHVAWTSGSNLGRFELTYVDDWRIALTYFDSLPNWESQQGDPLRNAFCEAGRSPWRDPPATDPAST